MRRVWPEELSSIFDDADEVILNVPAPDHEGAALAGKTQKAALRIRLTEDDYQRIWPFAEKRYRLDGRHSGKAVTLIANNPHYHAWHPADGGTVERIADSGVPYMIKYIIVHFLMEDVSEEAAGV